MSLLGCPQRTGSLLTPNLAERSPRSVWFFTIKSPQRREQYKLFEDHDNLGGFQRHLVRLGDKSPRVTNTERSSVKCFAWRLRGSLKGWLKSLLESLDVSGAWRRESLSSRNAGSKCFQVSGVVNRVKGAWTSFYSPQKESSRCGVKDPDMSGQETGYVRETLLEPGLSTKHVWC
jgi:hypothetical protein